MNEGPFRLGDCRYVRGGMYCVGHSRVCVMLVCLQALR